MIVKRVTVLVATGALAAGGAAVAAHAALASDDGTQPAASTPAAAPQTITRTIPGVGTVIFTVDPSTGAITNVVVTPLTAVTAGTPVVQDGKILIPVTLANGTGTTLRVKVNIEDGRVQVEAELENEPENEAEQPEPPTTEPAQHDDAPEGEQHQAPEAEHGEGEAPGVFNPSMSHHDDGSPGPSGSEAGGGQSGGSDGGHGGGND